MAAAQFTQYVVLTFNFRAIALGLIPAAGITAGAAVLIGYVMTRKVAKAENHWGLVGMLIGGACADMTGIWLTRGWQ